MTQRQTPRHDHVKPLPNPPDMQTYPALSNCLLNSIAMRAKFHSLLGWISVPMIA